MGDVGRDVSDISRVDFAGRVGPGRIVYCSVDWGSFKWEDTCSSASLRAGKTSRGGEGNGELDPRDGYISYKITLRMTYTFPRATL